ncbi:MAG: 4-hydroxybenzoate octaprenyltransferase, partial [Arenimonas sp.]|nr:4-hydroxybenzoate octaprenyltransferase [Arenimonas sp.]
AKGLPSWHLLLIFSVGVWLTRSAGCIINDYADQWLDSQVERTKNRPLAVGFVSGKQALVLFILMMLSAFSLVLLTNKLTILLSIVGVFLAASYPYMKRYTYFPQVYLGIAFGWGIIMAFAAVQNQVPKLAWLLFLANVLWTSAYDTWYAMVDKDDDIKAGSKSLAILLGDMDLVAIALLNAGFLLSLILLGLQQHFPLAYFICLSVAGTLLIWQLRIARKRHREDCFRAFINNQWVGLLVFIGFVLAFL